MTRQFSLAFLFSFLVSAVTLVGCGSGGDAQFEESEAVTATEEAEAEAYAEQYEADQKRMREEYGN